jgi:hypothetical protein
MVAEVGAVWVVGCGKLMETVAAEHGDRGWWRR